MNISDMAEKRIQSPYFSRIDMIHNALHELTADMEYINERIIAVSKLAQLLSQHNINTDNYLKIAEKSHTINNVFNAYIKDLLRKID